MDNQERLFKLQELANAKTEFETYKTDTQPLLEELESLRSYKEFSEAVDQILLEAFPAVEEQSNEEFEKEVLESVEEVVE